MVDEWIITQQEQLKQSTAVANSNQYVSKCYKVHDLR